MTKACNKRLLLTICQGWPASGYRTANSGALINVGNNGYYWSSARHSIAYRSYYLNFDYNGNVNPSNNTNRGNGFPVRCVQDFTDRHFHNKGTQQMSALSAHHTTLSRTPTRYRGNV